MRSGGPAESRADRRARARSLAGFFAAGALLSTIVVVLPGWDEMHDAGILVTVVLAGVTSALLYTFADRAGRVPIHAATAAGSLLIAACQVLAGGGSPSAMYGMLYIWVVLHASLFASRVAVALHLVLMTAAHAAGLIWLGEVTSIAPQLALTLGTQLATALIVVSLASNQRELADSDELTGLGNRRVVERALEWSTDRSRRTPEEPTCVAVLDLDGFKAYNDDHGHAAGDRVLVAAAAAWSALLRRGDALARVGGDEFVVVLVGCHLDEAAAVVARMVDATPAGVSCSAGLARWDGDELAYELLARADDALYEAKVEGPLVVATETRAT